MSTRLPRRPLKAGAVKLGPNGPKWRGASMLRRVRNSWAWHSKSCFHRFCTNPILHIFSRPSAGKSSCILESRFGRLVDSDGLLTRHDAQLLKAPTLRKPWKTLDTKRLHQNKDNHRLLVRVPAYFSHANVWATSPHTFEYPHERSKVCCDVARTFAWK